MFSLLGWNREDSSPIVTELGTESETKEKNEFINSFLTIMRGDLIVRFVNLCLDTTPHIYPV